MPDGQGRVRIEHGPQPFQIIQQDEQGLGQIHIAGQARQIAPGDVVQARIVSESNQSSLIPWQSIALRSDATWEHCFEDVPAGGLFRIETRLALDGSPPEWGNAGDTIHHIGVGDLWIIAGQSNAAGYGRGTVDDPPELGVHVLKNNERWDIAAHPLNDPTGSTHANAEIASPGHSPYLCFARIMQAALGYPIGLIQTALGNSRLAQWNPAENPDAPLYHNLLHCVRLAGGRVRGLLWYQGESDTNPGLAESYERRFADFVIRLRSDLNDPRLPIILAQSNRYTGPQFPEEHRGWSRLREAQRNARKLGNVAVVPTLDLPLSDDCHTSPAGNLALGRRKADAALAIAYGKLPPPMYLDVASAIRAVDGQSVELTFTGIASLLHFIAPGETDFAVEDEQGLVPIRRATCIARDRLRLELERTVSDNARIHSAYGANPTVNLRDADQNTPPLGFYGLPLSG